MNYQEIILDIKENILPGSHSGVERIIALLSLMDNPENKLKVIHIAGTNGKGSVSTMLSSILINAGYKTGLFTSPNMVSEREYFNVNGTLIEEEAFTKLWLSTKALLKTMAVPPSEFEVYTAMALFYYYQSGCDFVVLETGMGGTLDATNVIPKPLIAVITRIGYDHQEFLGNTIKEIAGHKAGIIKKGCDVICYPSEPDATSVITSRCAQLGNSLHIINPDDVTAISDRDFLMFHYHSKRITLNNSKLGMLGTYQRLNASLVLETIASLREKGWKISDENLLEGLKKARIPARFEILLESPLFIADGGHNPQCIEALTDSLKNWYPDKKFIILTGVMKDKEYKTMYRMLLDFAKEFITVTPDNQRALPADILAKEILALSKDNEVPVYAADSIEQGIMIAKSHSDNECGILATGTLYMMGEIKRCLSE